MKDREANRVVAVSIETTGLSEFEHEIIEIGAVKMINGVISDQFQRYVKPKKELPESVSELTGISNEMVAMAPNIEKVLKEFLSFTQDHILVAHNADFTMRFLKEATHELNIAFSPKWMDLLSASQALFPEFRKYNLHALCNRFGIPTVPWDTQVDEAKACAHLYRTLMGELEERGVSEDAFYRPITPALIIYNVCKYYGVNKEDLTGSNRSRRIAQPRRIAMFLIRRMTNESFVNIGKIFNRDHGSTFYAVNMVEAAVDKDNMLNVSIQEIITCINTGEVRKSLIEHPDKWRRSNERNYN